MTEKEKRHKYEKEKYHEEKKGAVKEWNARGLKKDEKRDRMKSFSKQNKPAIMKIEELAEKKKKKNK